MNNTSSKKIFLWIAVGTIALVGGLFALARTTGIGVEKPVEAASPAVESLALCLADKGVAMYGAYWCPHCQNQKRAFKSAWEKVPYVECTQEANRCIENKVESYPTWIFPDGRRLVGEQSFEALAEASGCAYSPGGSE